MLSVNNLSLNFSGQTLYNEISLNIYKGDRVGLIGKNGAGKSTLLKIIGGEDYTYSGTISKEKGLKIGYLSQDLDFKDDSNLIDEVKKSFEEINHIQKRLDSINEQMTVRTDYESDSYMKLIEDMTELTNQFDLAGGYTYEGDIEKVLFGLGFKREDFTKPTSEFSGGWRMRVELSKILLQNNDILLLDEPTNHLDIESVIWFEEFLKNFTGGLILISHDKTFLDNVTNRTIEIANNRIYDYKYNYSKFVETKKVIKEQLESEAKNQEKEIARKERIIEKFRAKSSKASLAQKLIKELDKVERIEIEQEDISSMNIKFQSSMQSGKIILEVEKLGKSYDKQVFSDMNMIIERGNKISLVGQNGQGKSTFIKIITDKVKEYEGNYKLGHNVKIGYFAQNQANELDGNITVLDTVFEYATAEMRPMVRTLLGSFLFSGEDVEKKVKVLSGGERNRLAICKILVQPYNFLIMDEPTNHLDIHSKNILKEALKKFDGTLLLVSHDRDFLDNLTEKCYEFRDGRVKEYLGDINFFLEQRKVESMREVEMKTKQEKVKKEKNTNKKEDNELEKKANKIETQISKLEKEVSKLEEELNNNYEKLSQDSKFFESYQNKKNKIAELTNQWEELLK